MESVADTILDYASRSMARCILFVVKSNSATIWASQGLPKDQRNGDGPTFPVGPDGIFGLTLGKGDYRGPVPDDPRFRSFYQELGIDIPTEILIFPVYLDDRLIAVLYGEGGPGSLLDVDNDEYRRLSELVTLSMNLVLVKNKILVA